MAQLSWNIRLVYIVRKTGPLRGHKSKMAGAIIGRRKSEYRNTSTQKNST